MKKKLLFGLLVVATCCTAVAQEVLLPLYGNPSVEKLSRRQLSRCKSARQSLSLPFFDDFSNYAGYPDTMRWADNSAFVNTGYAVFAPTVGVATLDAIDANGNLYSGIGLEPIPADTLTSLPIRLDSLFSPYQRQLTPADSIYFSFYFQPGGGYGNMWERVGAAPSVGDSLILEFLDATSGRWNRVWATGGMDLDTLYAHDSTFFRYVAIPIVQDIYLKSAFQFRFRNLVSVNNITKPGLSANCDMWNIDYVYLDYSRNSRPYFRDVAFVTPASSMLKRFYAMPTCQFLATDLRDTLQNTITNLYSQQLASNYNYNVYDERGTLVHSYAGGFENVPPFISTRRYQSSPAHARPPFIVTWPAMSNPRNVFRIVHAVTEGYTSDNHPQNDTTVFEQVFHNYYAYDDGVPENGYGLSSVGSRSMLAYRFPLATTDTLTAIDLFFNRTYNNGNAGIPFYICVWSDDGGKPGSLLYKAAQYAYPRFEQMNQYCRYPLEQPLVVRGIVYIGFEQHSTSYINLGFDRGNNTADNIFYHTSGQWQQSYLSGSLMMRPYFGHQAVVGLQQAEQVAVSIRLYPNPCKGTLFLDFEQTDATYGAQVYVCDMFGKVVIRQLLEKQVDVSALRAGVYILRIVGADGQTIKNEKFIITK